MKTNMKVEAYLVSETKIAKEGNREYELFYLEVNTPYGKQRIYLDRYKSRQGIILDVYFREKGGSLIDSDPG